MTSGIISSAERGTIASMRSISTPIGTTAVASSAARMMRRRSCRLA
jgi:hypothetical protein